ncbi:hypothetical protein JA1_002859 [Spathaspora sp. JA1]|nr:hypothetical protein JA1_002859 [Spathaspora sp. JA1]
MSVSPTRPASPSQIVEIAVQFLSSLDQTASSKTDILQPLIKYYDTFAHSLSDQQQIIPIISKLTWKYIFHPRLDISSVIFHSEWFRRFTIEVDHMTYGDWVMAMNTVEARPSKSGDVYEGSDEFLVCQSFLGVVGAFLGKFMSIVHDQKSGADVSQEFQGGFIKLVELCFNDGLSRAMTRRFVNCYPYINDYVTKRNDLVLCRVLHEFTEFSSMTIEKSLEFILQILDHGTTIKLNFKLVEKLSVAIETVHQCDLEVILHVFNKLNCKTSLVMTLNYLNYILSYNIGYHYLDSLPSSIVSQFQCLALPPIAKPEVQEVKEGVEGLLNTVFENQIPENLTIVQFRTIQLLARFLPQEALTIEHINQIKSSNLTERIVNKFIELVIASFCSALLLGNQSKYKQGVIHATFHTLLSVKFTTASPNQAWIILINTANDICYADLKYIPTFITLFEYLMKKNPGIMDDDLIKSGLNFFINTFDPEYEWFTKRVQAQPTYEINMDDYKVLYSDAVPPVKSGRQQSIHVDMYKS